MTAPMKKKSTKNRPNPQADAVRRLSQRRAAQPKKATDPVVAQFDEMLARDMEARDWEAVEADFLWLGRYFEGAA